MELMDAIRARASYRQPFSDQPVPRAEREEMVEAGYLAPSGGNAQTTRLIAVDDPALAAKLAAIYGAKWAASALAAILVITCETPSYQGHSYHIEDAAAATENILLAIAAKGYATTWVQGQIEGEKARQMGELLGIPDGMQVYVYLPLGVPANPVTHPKKKPLEERAWFNRFGG